MIELKELYKKYGSHIVLNGISLDVKKGSVFGFLGHNGAGKSTTMNILTGLINYDSGIVRINGKDMKSNKNEIMKNVGYLPETPKFYPYMNAYEYLSFIGNLSGYSKKEIRNRSKELLKQVKLESAEKRRIGGYSRGMKQRLGLAVSIFNKPEILFLDEPSSALDPEGRREIIEIIQNLKKQDITVFLSTHILNDVERVCDEVVILNDGEIALQGKLNKIKEDYILPVYDIEFENSIENIKELLLKESWIYNIHEKNKLISVYVKDRDTAKKQLLKLVSRFDNPVTSYSMRKSNLEDIFLRVVNKNE
ncbi:ABC transporter ATP-binding protein [Sporosalibacterium faouarense]|uniref:ABC transporter ATP-binding protein n=1 Tax=Sporosalibacterium faouarense TaxID=516123 RepID=UPI00192C2178|nr:ABC transporter ATP-binding protein [Sporosalibacterium faouarense]